MNTINSRLHYYIYTLPVWLLAGILPLAASVPCATLICPEDVVIQLEPGECGQEVFFDTLEWSSNVTLTDTVFFPPSGTYFETGVNVVTLAVTDINGNLEVCNFNVIINEFMPASLDCLNNVTLSLEGVCDRNVLPEELLLADSTGCFGNYEVIRLNQGGVGIPPLITGNDIGSTFIMVVQHPESNMQCLTQVTVSGGTPPAITCPANITIFCNVPADSANIGFPAFSGCYQDLEIGFFDETNSTFCPDTFAYQTVRYWTSNDPFGNKDTCQQLITAMRYDVNQVQFPADRNGIAGPVLLCDDTLTWPQLADPSVTGVPTFANFPADGNEDCKISVGYVDVETQVCGAAYEIERIWTVVKLCNPPLTLRDTQYISIADTQAPVFTIPDTIYFSLDAECADTLFLPPATDISECSSFDINIFTDWDTLSTNGGWTAIDLTAGSYAVAYQMEDECGNVSRDTATLLVDGLTLASCPPADTVSCDFYFDVLVQAIASNDLNVLGQLGMPEYHANCEFNTTEVDSNQVDNCGNGFLIRTMTSDAAVPQTCVQEITVVHVSDFEVVFPEDLSICTNPANAGLSTPTVINQSCENILTDLTDEVVPGGQPGCYTLRRHWRVINNCIYTGVNSNDDTVIAGLHFADGGDGIVTYTQEIQVNDQVQPTFPEGCEVPDMYLDASSCEAQLILSMPLTDGCSTLTLTGSGDLGPVTGILIDTSLTTGSYTVNYLAQDSCGNFGTCTTMFEVIDTVAPVAVCIAQVEIEIGNPQDPITIFAIDYNEGSSDNCGNLQYSFSPDPTVISHTYADCCEAESGPVEIWVTDANGNQSSCMTFISFQDSLSTCHCDPLISGALYNEGLTGIGNAEVLIESPGGFYQALITDITGFYEQLVPEGEDITITPLKNTNPVNGVTTFDGVLMTRHILGTVPLTTPYLLIAADINNSGAVTTFDIVEMRRVILGINTGFTNNTSWRFVPADFEFPIPTNPFSVPFPETVQLNAITQDSFNLNFIGIKIGDLNGNADPAN